MRLRLLSLNLQCWQQEDAERKLIEVARFIAAHAVDVVCFQEVGQLPDRPETNAAAVVVGELGRLGHKFDWAWDWAHMGYDRWQEGVAVLVRGKVLTHASKFVSRSSDREFWKTRNALRVRVLTERGAELTLVSTHLGWYEDTEEPFAEQWQKLLAWCENAPTPLLIAGDLNQPAGGPGHALITQTSNLMDCDLLGAPTFPGNIAGWEGHSGARIDYVLRLGAGPDPTASELHFTGDIESVVSDHFALCIDFEWPEPAAS